MAEPLRREPFSLDQKDKLPACLRRLASDSEAIKNYAIGSTIMGRNSDSDKIVYIISGSASVVLRDEDKEKISVDSLGPGDIFGGVEFFTGVPWQLDSELIADESTQVMEIQASDFESLLRHDPDFIIGLVKNLVRKLFAQRRNMFRSKLKRRALHSLISSEEHIFQDYVVGDYVRKNISSRLAELAASDGPALIIGESGVGKEVLAHRLFKQSRHGKEVFLIVDLNKAESPAPFGTVKLEAKSSVEETIEQQLKLFFGMEEPGIDGGTKETPGYFELTDDGTLLVRGVERLMPIVQMKLLEALVTQTFRRVNGVRTLKSKVRLIATTRLEVSEITLEEHPFVYALLDRSVSIPPLRNRRKEIPILARHYLKKYTNELGRDVGELSEETLQTLLNYSWPGNDLELSNSLKRAILVCERGVLRPQDIYFDLKRVEDKWKFNLLRLNFIRRAFLSPLYPAVLQSAAVPFFFIILVFLFLGPQDPLKNPAALIAWSIGWPILIIGALFWARFWCSLCPIGVIASLSKKIMALERPFPAFLKRNSDFLIAGAVLFVIWFETATAIRNSPLNLGLLLLAMLLSAILVSMVYERQTWCLYLCGLGGMVGVLSKTSIVELRANGNVCISECSSNECYLGTAERSGCPFGHAGPRLRSNRVCKVCGQCLKNCPHGAISLNLRAPGQEIWQHSQRHAGTAFLVLGMIGGLFSEMVTEMPEYATFTSWLPFPAIVNFSIVFLIILVVIN
ncbi:MAG: sigma 54-interacting transcriptional regulator, partial [Syntrophaceae bacterium]|nr:sigma 54-interacting transcriptional regulator [Syntrophaceae bacterium]